MEIFGSDDDLSAQRKVHHRRDRLPVFQIDDKKGNTLFAFRSRLRARLEGMSAHKESRIAAAIVSRWREAFGVESEDVGQGALDVAIGKERLFEFIQICSIHPSKMASRRAKINNNLPQRLAAGSIV